MTPLAETILAACGRPKQVIAPLATPAEQRHIAGEVRRLLLGTQRRYMADDALASAAGALAIEHPDLLSAMLADAWAPLPSIWLEWPLRPFLAASGMRPLDTAPERIGVLIEQQRPATSLYRMTVINTDEGQLGPAMVSVLYDVTAPLPPAMTPDHDLIGRVVIDSNLPVEPDSLRKLINPMLLGNAYTGRVSSETEPDGLVPTGGPLPYRVTAKESETEDQAFRRMQCDRLAVHGGFALSPIQPPRLRSLLHDRGTHADGVRRAVQIELREYVGTWRNILALLYLLNQRDYVTSQSVARGPARMVLGKRVPALPYEQVTLKLPRQVVIERAIRAVAPRLPMPQQVVETHLRHSRKRGDPNCQHVYVQETPSRERCLVCTAARWRVREHTRGDESLGVIQRDRRLEMR